MTNPQVEGWEPGTAQELVADAHALGVAQASPRMITDWTEHGLLGPPVFQKTTRRGSDPRLYSGEQRRLFTEMLKARQRSPLKRVPHHTLIRPVLHVWLNYDTVVSDAQARRAWRTWARASKSTASRRDELARSMVDRFAHPDAPYHQRRKVHLLLVQAEKTRVMDWGKLYSALTEVSSPWPAPPGQRIERGFGPPELPFGVQEQIAIWIARFKVYHLLATEQADEAALVEARAELRREWPKYEANRQYFQSRATHPEMFAKPSELEEQVKEQVDAFPASLAHTLGIARQAFDEAKTLAIR